MVNIQHVLITLFSNNISETLYRTQFRILYCTQMKANEDFISGTGGRKIIQYSNNETKPTPKSTKGRIIAN